MKHETGISVLWLSLPLAILVAITSWAGLFWPPTYAQEKPLWGALGMGGDAVNLVLAAPVLLGSALLAYRGSIPARLVWMGTLVYLLYNFVIYCLAVHFNGVFLVYCGGLGLSFYALAGNLRFARSAEVSVAGFEIQNANFESCHRNSAVPRKTIAVAFLVMALMITGGYLRELIPASITGQAPESITSFGLCRRTCWTCASLCRR